MSYISRGLLTSELNVANAQTVDNIHEMDHIKPSKSGNPVRNTTQRYEKMIMMEAAAPVNSRNRFANTQTHDKISVKPLD